MSEDILPTLKTMPFRPLLTKEELQDLYDESNYKPPSILPRATNGRHAHKSNAHAPAGRISKVNNTSKPKSSMQKFVVKPDRWDVSSYNTLKRKTTDSRAARKKLFSSAPNQQIIRKSTTTFTKKVSTNQLSFHSSTSTLMDISDVENEIPNLLKFKMPKITLTDSNDLTNISSPGEKEFVKLERHYKGKKLKNVKIDQFQSEIENILLSEEEHCNNLKLKFIQLQIEFEQYSATQAKNRKHIQKLLKNNHDSENTMKKKVAFVLSHNSDLNQLNPADEGLEKANTLYNSIRKNCSVLLATPKLNRSCLQTPKSTRKPDTISRKLQKQCLLLQDTPAK